jgi:hypothetical protein
MIMCHGTYHDNVIMLSLYHVMDNIIMLHYRYAMDNIINITTHQCFNINNFGMVHPLKKYNYRYMLIIIII